jgi:hypothetical protein
VGRSTMGMPGTKTKKYKKIWTKKYLNIGNT